MKNIFENAYFGKAYRTRNGRKAILLDNTLDLFILNFGIINNVDSFIQYSVSSISGILIQNGKEFTDYPCELDIVSEWEEPIDGEKLDEKAHLFYREQAVYMYISEQVQDAYKAGYKQGWEDKP